MPGGRKNKNETNEEAAIREVFEETGLHIKIANLVATYEKTNTHKKKLLFTGEIESGEMALSDQTKDIRWFNVNELPFNVLRYEVNRIREAKNFNGTPIEKEYFIDYKTELNHLIKRPAFAIYLVAKYAIKKRRRLMKRVFPKHKAP